MKTLVIDIGGTNVKVWMSGENDSLKFASGRKLKPARFMREVSTIAGDWNFDRVSIGYPGTVRHGRPVSEPWNLGSGWVAFDWSSAFPLPLRIMNDACMQALGSYEGGRMLYLGLGTGIGTALVIDGKIVSLALGHLQFQDGHNFDYFMNRDGIKRHGLRLWKKAVLDAGEILRAAFEADYVVFGGGNAKRLTKLPEGFRRGGNHNAYFGGLRMWDDATPPEDSQLTVVMPHETQAG